MKMEETYLSDEELDLLIFEIEQNELVSTPPGFADEILTRIGKQQEQENILLLAKENKRIEFRRYCLRVITSVAAAVALVFFMPEAEMAEARSIPEREAVVGKVITREKALDDTGMITKIWNELNMKIGGLSNETEKKE